MRRHGWSGRPVLVALCISPSPLLAQAQQSALQTAGPQAQNIEGLWWTLFYGGCAIFLAVMVLLFVGLWRARGSGGHRLSEAASRNLVLVAGVIVPLIVLLAMVGGSLMIGRSIAAQPPDDALHVRVIGHMWWWEIEYLDSNGAVVATTANELHVPVDRPVALHLRSADVIHSFWVPALHGKTDMLPGVDNLSWFTATEAGQFRGQCAEFCGEQHALMAFLVIAQPQSEFRRWLARLERPAQVPTSGRLLLGYRAFIESGCADCHSVRGTDAVGQRGPDLTHIASRRSLAAVTRANTRGHLGGWISDPQSIKPGSFMPKTLLTPEQHTALLGYLESLE